MEPAPKRTLSDISPTGNRAQRPARPAAPRPEVKSPAAPKAMITAEEFGMPKLKSHKPKVAGAKPPFWLFVLLFVVLPALAAGAAYYIYYIKN